VNGKTRGIVLQMVMAFVICILLVQLWLFTEALEAMHSANGTIAATAMICSGLGCAAVWKLIGFFLRAETKSE
jgi:hypothetical protein